MLCKKCGHIIPEDAIVCTKCGTMVKRKRPVYKKWWFWMLMGFATIITLAAIGSSGNSVDVSNNENPSTGNSQTSTTTKVSVTYEVTDLKTMLDDLDSNALKAEKTYQGKNVEVVGVIRNFDSDGSYISIEPANYDKWSLNSVMCYIKNEDQRNFLLEKEIGDSVTIKGKITSVGEILGYSIKIAEIY